MNILKLLEQLGGGTSDNRQTNKMVKRGQLPQRQQEIYPQRNIQQLQPKQRMLQAEDGSYVPESFYGGRPQLGYGATDEQVQGGGFNPVDPQFGAVGQYNQMRNIQGGYIPLQQSNMRYRQSPQPTQPWYDF